MPERRPKLLLSCGIFREELQHLRRTKGLRGEVVYLEASLHVDFGRLAAGLSRALAECGERNEVSVLYGACHPEMDDILGRHGASRLRAGNCIEALLGAGELARLDRERKTFFLSVGWVNHWEEMFATGEAALGIDFRESFAGYERALVLDTGLLSLDEDKVAAFASFAGLPVERRAITLEHFEGLVAELCGGRGDGT